MGVSQRHVSFVESGRAKPSRELLIAWLQAGYAPMYRQFALQDAPLLPANDALMHLLRNHSPMPAFVIDAHWNVHINARGRWLALTLMPWLASVLKSGAPLNMLDALCHPEGFTQHLINLHEVAPTLLEHIQGAAWLLPSLAPKAEAFAALVRN